MKHVLCIIFLSILLSGYSQNDDGLIKEKQKSLLNNSSGTSNVYTPTTTSNRNYDMKHFISINLPGLLIGDFPIYYERNIVRHFNIQAGLGITFDNFMYDNTTGNPNFIFGENSKLNNNLIHQTYIGPSFMIAPKFYFGKKNFESFYIGLEFRYRQYNYFATAYDSSVYNYRQFVSSTTYDMGKTVNESRQVLDFLIEIGQSHFFGKHLNFQYYTGIGARTNIYYVADVTNTNVSASGQFTFQLNHQTVSQQGIAFTGGFRMGYVF